MIGDTGIFRTSSGVYDLDYINISSIGNSNDFATLTTASTFEAFGNGIVGYFYAPAFKLSSINTQSIVISTKALQYSTTGGVFSSQAYSACVYNTFKAVVGGGQVTSGTSSNAMQYITFTSYGPVTTTKAFGELALARTYIGGMSNKTYGLFAGGLSTTTSLIDYITFSTLSNAVSWGNLTSAYRGSVGVSDGESQGVFMGGYGVSNIEYVTFSIKGNTSLFGNLTSAKTYGTGVSNKTRACYISGNSTTTIDYIIYSTIGNATTFGECVNGTFNGSGSNPACSGN